MQTCLPYAAWRAPPTQPPHRRIGAVVALAWGRHVFLLDVPLAAPHEEPGAGALISFQYVVD